MLLSKIYTETERTSLSIALCGFVEKSMKTLFENGPKKWEVRSMQTLIIDGHQNSGGASQWRLLVLSMQTVN